MPVAHSRAVCWDRRSIRIPLFRHTQSPAANCRPTIWPNRHKQAYSTHTDVYDTNRRIDRNGRIRHKRAYSTRVFDTGPVTPAMTHHRTRADEWSIPHTGRVPMLPGSVLDRLDPGRVVCCHRLSVAWLVLTAGVCAHDGVKFVQRNCG